MINVIGYDGSAFTVGDRVEIHPGTDLWMQGARYGTVVKIVPEYVSLAAIRGLPRHIGPPEDRVRVKMDKVRGSGITAPADRFRTLKGAVFTRLCGEIRPCREPLESF